jgi:hypothetical protein
MSSRAERLKMHYQTEYAVVACGYYVGDNGMTTDPAKVTCGLCKRSRRFRAVTGATPEPAS